MEKLTETEWKEITTELNHLSLMDVIEVMEDCEKLQGMFERIAETRVTAERKRIKDEVKQSNLPKMLWHSDYNKLIKIIGS